MISILIPVYNVEQYITRCLESIDSQTYDGDIECILVNDGSKDESLKLIDNFIRKSKSTIAYKIINHDCNRGLAAARNTGVAAAKGEFIIHVDSDDWLEPTAIALLSQKQSETGADIVSGNAVAHYENYKKPLIEPEYMDNLGMVRNTIKMTLDHVIWRRLIRKKLYTDNGIEAEEGVNYGEDHHTLPRLAYYAKKIVKLDAFIYNYNCININSYIRITNNKVTETRYLNDRRSLQILENFFHEKNNAIAEEVEVIRKRFEKNMRLKSIGASDYETYLFLCQNQDINPRYKLDCCLYYLTKFRDEIKSSIKKIYRKIIAK